MTRAPVPHLEVDDLVVRLRKPDDEDVFPSRVPGGPLPIGDEAPILRLVVDRAGVMAGAIDVHPRGRASAEITWGVLPTHRGTGVATRSVRRVIEYAFSDMGFERIEAYCPRDEPAAQWVATRAGMRFECYRRGIPVARGGIGDFAQFAVLPGDPEPGTREFFLTHLNARMPRKRIIAQGFLRDAEGRFLLCELTYKREWDLPGGVVDPSESPRAALERELAEEMGVTLRANQLLAVNWLPPFRQWEDAMLFVFGVAVPDYFDEQLRLEAREIRAVHWCTLGEAIDQVAPYLAVLLPQLLDSPHPAYLDAGVPVF